MKIVVWDSIGNTLLGVRPWASWDAPVQETLLRENPAAETVALPLREILAGYDVDLIWFNSADAPYAPFGQLYADYEGSLRFTRSVDEIVRAIEDADFLVLHKERLPAEALERAKQPAAHPASRAGLSRRAAGGRPRARHPGRGHPAGQLHHRRRAGLGLHPQLGQAPARAARRTWRAAPTSIPGTASRTPSTSAT